MSKSFYDYIVEDLILGYFKQYPLIEGSRYFLLVENPVYRDGLMKALENSGAPIVISNIYQGPNIPQDAYNTFVLKAQNNECGLIIAYDRTCTEDYMTTIRNTVGVEGSPYEKYGILYILSDTTSSILSSINTAVKDLQAPGAPLSAGYIMKKIKENAQNEILQNYQIAYIDKYLERISSLIGDGTCSLFDFQNALNILAKGSLKGDFNNIDCFNDQSIFDQTFVLPENEVEDRALDNMKYYGIVKDIMNMDDDEEKYNLLINNT